MLENGKAVSQDVAKENGEFCPMFITYKGDEIAPMPMPNYTKDRQYHQAMMRAILKGIQAEAQNRSVDFCG